MCRLNSVPEKTRTCGTPDLIFAIFGFGLYSVLRHRVQFDRYFMMVLGRFACVLWCKS